MRIPFQPTTDFSLSSGKDLYPTPNDDDSRQHKIENRNKYHLPLHASSPINEEVVALSVNKKRNAITSSSKKIREMATSLCTMLVQKVVTVANMDGDDDASEYVMDLAALERLAKAMQMSKHNDPLETTNKAAPTNKFQTTDTPVEKEKENLVQDRFEMGATKPPPNTKTAYTESLSKPETEVALSSEPKALGAEYDTTETEALDLQSPKAERSHPPLEIVESNVVPLRPSSIPQKKESIVMPEKAQQNQLSSTSEHLPPVPLPQALEEEEETSVWDSEPSTTVFEATKAWDLDSILTGVAKDEKSQANENTDATTQIQNDASIREREKYEELFQRRLLQRRLELDATTAMTRTTTIGIEEPPATTSEFDGAQKAKDDIQDEPLFLQEQKMEELFRRRLLQKRLEFEDGAQIRIVKATKTINAKTEKHERSTNTVQQNQAETSIDIDFGAQTETMLGQKAGEMFQRRLLKTKLDIDAQAETIRRQKTGEMFQRRLLKTKLEFDAQSKAIQAEKEVTPKKTNRVSQTKIETSRDIKPSFGVVSKRNTDELFQRRLLQERLERNSRETAKIEEKSKEKQLYQWEDSKDANPAPGLESLESKELVHRRLSNEASIGYDSQSASAKLEKEEYAGSEVISDSTPTIVVEEEIINPEIRSYAEDALNQSPRDWVSSLPTVARERYARGARVSHSFVESEFKPAWWAKNDHFQTIVGTLYRKATMYSRGSRDANILLEIAGFNRGKTPEIARSSELLDQFQWDKRTRVETNDGDFFVVDWKHANADGPNNILDTNNNDSDNDHDHDNPICLICHGLESCSDSEIARELAIACNDKNIDAACINFRGCSDGGEECNLTHRAYHLGFTDDLMQQIEAIHSENPRKRIYLSGFSLGAGVVTKLLADLGEDAHRYNICGAAVNAVPFDTTQYHQNLNEPGFTKTVYGSRLLKSMQRRMKQQYDTCDAPVFSFERSKIDECKTIMDLENLIIAPVFGFDDAMDYYNKTKTIDKLHKVCVPELVVQARDDPFFDGLKFPANDPNRPLRIQYTDQGGHCGYIFHKLGENENENKAETIQPKTSWMPAQLARFLAHLEENRNHHRDSDRDDLSSSASLSTPARMEDADVVALEA